MVDDTDIGIVWRGIGRGLDRCFPPETENSEKIAELLEALRARDLQKPGADGDANA